MTFPLATLEDESAQVARGMIITEVLGIVPLGVIFILAIATIGSFFLLYKLYKKNDNLFLIVIASFSIVYYFLLCRFASQFLLNKFNSLDPSNLLWLVRYGSLGAVTYTLQLMTFGYREWGMRFFPLFFSILSAIGLYKLICLYKNENWALFSSVSLLFMPGIFYYINISQLTTGIIFFIITSIYFLMGYILKDEKKYLIYMCLSLILGFQYKEVFLLIYGTIFGYLLYLYFFIKKKIDYKPIIKYLALSLIPTLIWLITQVFFNNNTNLLRDRFLPSEQNIVYIISRYFINIPSEATWPFAILFVLSLPFALYSIFKKKDELTFVFLINFLIMYSMITFDSLNNYMIIYRYGADLLLPLSFLAFIPLDLIRKKRWIKRITYCLIIFLMVTSTYLTYHNWENRFVPMDGTFSYIQENIPESDKILRTMAPNPYKFYIAKYDIKNEMDHVVWTNVSDQNITNLYEFMEKKNYTYFIFPKPTLSYHSYWPNDYSWVYTMRITKIPVLNETLLHELIENNDYFKVVYQDNLGPNSLFIVKKID